MHTIFPETGQSRTQDSAYDNDIERGFYGELVRECDLKLEIEVRPQNYLTARGKL